MIELKIGGQAITDKIARKSIRNGVILDTVAFEESKGWFKNAFFRFRNVSGQPIYGVTADFYFRPANDQTIYSLPLTASTALKQGVVQPGGEVILTVNDQMWNIISDILSRHSVDPDEASVKFLLDMVRFSDNTLWQKGQLLQRGANDPFKFSAVPKGEPN